MRNEAALVSTFFDSYSEMKRLRSFLSISHHVYVQGGGGKKKEKKN